MALVLADRVRESTLTTGTGTVTLVGPVTGYQTFAAIGNGNTTYYTISNPNGTEWEVGIGTYTAASKTLSRDTVLSSSNGGLHTSFSVGSKDVFVSYPAEKSINQDEVGNTFVPNLGATTPSSGVFTTLTGNSTSQFGRSSDNYFQAVGAAANLSPEISVLGSDTNIPFTIESKGTGAVNVAAGSRGVNVSNGQTVTALTRTATGTGYTSIPTVTISAPTTAGGVQATATCTMGIGSASIVGGGTGYSAGDTLTIVGGTFFAAATLTVNTVSSGVITSVSVATGGSSYSVLPTNPVSVTGGTGSGATFNVSNYFVSVAFTITNAGSGYVEQPTVTFSGGGGSGAAAYATVGSGTTVRSIGSTMSIVTPGGESLRVAELGGTVNTGLSVFAGSSGQNSVYLSPYGSGVNSNFIVNSKGTGFIALGTNSNNNEQGREQLRVSHTASAVNYVQVTGAATTGATAISSQGSDAAVSMLYQAKGSAAVHQFRTAGNSNIALQIQAPSGGANHLSITGVAAGSAPSLSSAGSDTNVGLNLQSKGTGAINLQTAGGTTQLAVTNTASAVNYVQVTGGATGSAPGISVVGSDTNISLGFNAKGSGIFTFVSNGGEQFRVQTIANAVNNIQVYGNTSGIGPTLISRGTDTNVSLNLATKGTGAIALQTGTSTLTQFQVTDTANAVNYVQVSGAATGSDPTLSAQGSDSSINFTYLTKGASGEHRFSTNTGGNTQFRITHTASAANYLRVTGAIAGAAPAFSVAGSDTNIDLSLTPKGTGLVRFGTYVAGALTATGSINIKAADGTTYKVLVST